jgi:protein-disulfide isomerase
VGIGRLLKTSRSAIGFVLITTAFVGCGASTAPDTSEKSHQTGKQDWAQEEILLQLKEMREDINQLRQDAAAVKSLDTRISALEAVARKAGNSGDVAAPVREVLFGDAVPQGLAGAKVAVVEFTDFECPFCARHHHEVFPELKKAFIDTGRIRYYVRNYPLSFHASARPAAIAAFCAGKAGKFWEMHEELFSKAGALRADSYREAASAVGINPKRFSECVEDPASSQRLDAEVQYANGLGVSGTPKFFIGRIEGKKIVDVIQVTGARPLSTFSAAIQSLLGD